MINISFSLHTIIAIMGYNESILIKVFTEKRKKNTKCVQLFKGKESLVIQKDTFITISNYQEDKITEKFL